ncbi:hypothetical protein DdX_20569 [Ditylenchus destructor]|uniref:Uncharacterized protein n=1 Tax=Ditylenchus destructor TaxID=166010 RepID=A0AAD4MG28_9BILA|nr:hypothetical protein DdX_20569 [Ditylenchus destructor]
MIWLKKISALISVIYFFLWIQACIRTGDGMVRSVSMRNLKTAAEQAARTATRSGSRSRSSSRSGEFGKVPARSHSTPPSQARRRSVSVERPSGQPRRRSPSFSRDISPVRNGNTLSNVKALVERQGFGTSRLGLHTHQTVGSKNAADILLRGGDEVVVQSFGEYDTLVQFR